MFLMSVIFIFMGQAEVTQTLNERVVEAAKATPSIQNDCRDLEVGQSVEVFQVGKNSLGDGNSPTGMNRFYRLTRLPGKEKHFQADVFLHFDLGSNYYKEVFGLGSMEEKEGRLGELNAKYFMYARDCLKKINPYLRSKDGTRLTVNLLVDEEKNHSLNKISVKSADTRSSSNQWSRNLNCSTVVHEIFHHMGLCDGYRESVSAYHDQILRDEKVDIRKMKQRYDCRSIEPKKSIMTSPDYAVRMAQATSYEVMTCSSEKGLPKGVQKAKKIPTICPALKDTGLLATGMYHKRMSQKQLDDWVRGKPDSLFYVAEKSKPFLLQPAQMRLITKPFCYKENKLYIECSQNAYRHSMIQGCLNVNPRCYDGTHLE